MYNNLDEARTLGNVLLSEAQKFILTKLLLPDSTPLLGYQNISVGKNIVANRDVLVKLGMLTLGDNEAEITEAGTEALRNEGLVDEAGQLSDLGERYAYAEDLEAVEKISAEMQAPGAIQPAGPDKQGEPPAPGSDGTPPMGIANQSDQEAKPSFESWSMVTEFQQELSKRTFLKNHKKS